LEDLEALTKLMTPEEKDAFLKDFMERHPSLNETKRSE
jgi:hypothetical protein